MLSVGRIYAGGGESGLPTDDKTTAAGKRRVAGGWRYLWEQVNNGAEDYYSADVARGETKGRWGGSAAEPELGLAGEVTEAQMERVFGLMVHPAEAAPLGNAPRQYRSVAERLEAARALHDGQWMGQWATREAQLVAQGAEADAIAAELDGHREAAARRWADTEVSIRRGGERAAVAGFDLTFSPPKSVSVLWAAADAEGRAAIWRAHHEGVSTALGYVEREAAWSRTGFNGVAQVGSTGMVIASFDHRMSRRGDVQIHTHNAVLNRVRCDDGEWRTLDGRAVYAVAASAGALYDRVREAALERELGVRHEQRKEAGPREIVGVDDDVCRLFSSRRVQIEGRLAEMVAAYTERHGFEPSQWTTAQMSQWATLETRRAKHGTETTVEALARWEAESRTQLRRSLAEVWAQAVPGDRAQALPGDQDRPLSDEEALARAITAVDTEQATWTRYDLARQLTLTLAVDADTSGADLLARVDALVERATGGEPARLGVVDLNPPPAFATPPKLRRRADDQSVYQQHGAGRYTTDEGLAREMRILDAARRLDGPRVESDQVDAVLAAGNDTLGHDQTQAARQVVTSGRRLEALVGPAGTGKTHTVGAVARVWQAAGGEVIGLAVAETAARALASEARIPTVNTAKLLWEHQHRSEEGKSRPEWQAHYAIAPGALVILDEAGMASRQVIDDVARLCQAADAKLLLVGDAEQLASPEAGGTFALVVDQVGAAHLGEVRRFSAQWERQASLRLREGDVDVLCEYNLRARVVGGTETEMEDAAFRAAAADRARGARPFLLADTNEQAARLAGRTRDQLVAAGAVDDARTVNLADGNRAGVGDRIVTRRNDRTNGSGGRFVANRDVWQVTAVDDDGTVRAGRIDPDSDQLVVDHQVRLGAEYVAVDVQLEYAGTVHSGQGGTRAVSHAIVTPATTRQALYVALSRGRDDNRAYVVASQPEGADLDGISQDPLAVLAGIIERHEQPAEASAIATRERLGEAERTLARLFPIWQDLVATASRARWQAAVAAAAGPQVAAEMVASEAWPTLAARLRVIDTAGVDSASALAAAAAARTLAGSEDVAAVLHWRLRHTEAAVAATAQDSFAEISPPAAGEYRTVIAEVAAAMDARSVELGRRVAADPPAWAAELGPQPDDRDAAAGAEWRRRAGVVAGYREAFGLDRNDRLEHHRGDAPAPDPIGISPPPGRPDAAQWWRRAAAALHRTQPASLADLPDEHLEAIVDQARRAERAAPPTVEAQLQAASAELREQRTVHGEAIAARHPTAGDIGRTVDALAAQVADLENSQRRREQWRAGHAGLHSRAEAAAAELAARAAARASWPHWDMDLGALEAEIAHAATQLAAAQLVVQRRQHQAERWQHSVEELRSNLADVVGRRPETTAAEAVVAAEQAAAARIDDLRRSLAETRLGRPALRGVARDQATVELTALVNRHPAISVADGGRDERWTTIIDHGRGVDRRREAQLSRQLDQAVTAVTENSGVAAAARNDVEERQLRYDTLAAELERRRQRHPDEPHESARPGPTATQQGDPPAVPVAGESAREAVAEAVAVDDEPRRRWPLSDMDLTELRSALVRADTALRGTADAARWHETVRTEREDKAASLTREQTRLATTSPDVSIAQRTIDGEREQAARIDELRATLGRNRLARPALPRVAREELSEELNRLLNTNPALRFDPVLREERWATILGRATEKGQQRLADVASRLQEAKTGAAQHQALAAQARADLPALRERYDTLRVEFERRHPHPATVTSTPHKAVDSPAGTTSSAHKTATESVTDTEHVAATAPSSSVEALPMRHEQLQLPDVAPAATETITLA